MTEAEELAYERGRRMFARRVLQECVSALGDEGRTKESWRIEREEAIAALRDVCGDFGDQDWDERLNLADVIEKHLGRHLHAALAAEEPER